MSPRPSPVRVAAALVAVEGAAVATVGVAYGVAGLAGDPLDRTATELLAVMALVVGGLLLLVARGLSRTAGWARSPAVVAQLFALPVGVGLAQGSLRWAAVPVLALAAGVLCALATPSARTAYSGSD